MDLGTWHSSCVLRGGSTLPRGKQWSRSNGTLGVVHLPDLAKDGEEAGKAAAAKELGCAIDCKSKCSGSKVHDHTSPRINQSDKHVLFPCSKPRLRLTNVEVDNPLFLQVSGRPRDHTIHFNFHGL